MSRWFLVLFALFLSIDLFVMNWRRILFIYGLLLPRINFFFLGACLFKLATNLCSKASYESPQSFKAAARFCLKSSDEKFLKSLSFNTLFLYFESKIWAFCKSWWWSLMPVSFDSVCLKDYFLSVKRDQYKNQLL